MGTRKKKRDPSDAPEPLVVGWRERVALPDLGIKTLRAKIDTGARTSALFARDVELFERGSRRWVRFVVYPRQGTRRGKVQCEAPLVDIRDVRSSSGHVHRRAVIRTEVVLDDRAWPIEITLAKRKNLKYRMLIGRQALAGHCLVDSGGSYLLGRPHRKKRDRGTSS